MKLLYNLNAHTTPGLILCLAETEFHQARKKLGLPKTSEYWCPSDGCTWIPSEETSPENCYIVCLALDITVESPLEIMGLLVHEAVHVWQAHCRHMNEELPGDEIEAFGIQDIAMSLFYEYERRFHGGR
jgi:hypothetical protein